MSKHFIIKLFVVTAMAVAFSGCYSPQNPKGNETRETGNTQDANLPKKQIQNRLPDENEATALPADTAEKAEKPVQIPGSHKPYALHIPPGISAGEKAPVIFIFDPHAGGHLPVEKYSDLADEFGFVLVGSNESRNNQPIEDGLKYYMDMKNGIKNQVNIDENRLYVMGFSGGARVAVSIAIQQKDVEGVIGCGAGFPAVRQLPQPDFYYFAMVGYEDFNMGELINNDRLLKRSGFDNELVIFDGGHEWPPQQVMREAFLAILIHHMALPNGHKNQKLINKTISYYNDLIDDYKREGRYFDAAETAQRAASVLGGVVNTDDFKSQAKSFKKNPRYNEDLSAMVKTMERETGLQQNYLDAFRTKGPQWWKAEIRKIKTPVDDVYEQRLNKRLEAFVGLMAYMMTNKALSEHDLEQAQRSLEVYRMIEPANPEHAYLGAVVSMELGDENAAEKYLQQSIVLGFNNKERFRQEEAFKNLPDRDRYLEMMN